MDKLQTRILFTLLAIIIFLLGFLTFTYASEYFQYDVTKVDKYCEKNISHCDSIAIAYQLGRLDLVSVCLALVGVAIAMGAVFGFLSIREKSEYIAKSIAEKYIKEHLVEFEKKLPKLLEPKISMLFDEYKAIKENENGSSSDEDEWANNVE